MTASEVRELIESGLEEARVEVATQDEVHFQALVVSPEFEGRRTLQRHQLVYGTLGGRMGGEIHALSLKTLTPAELERQAQDDSP